jgi:5-methylcytosine-specific restriction protein A
MSLKDITKTSAIHAAVEEFDDLGREAFLRKYGFGPAKAYFLVLNGRKYDSKAIMGAAHGHQHPDQGALKPEQFSGGHDTVVKRCRSLEFFVGNFDRHPDCLCCAADVPIVQPRVCPVCGHEFQGNGWGGIDAHWRSRHEDVMKYEAFRDGLCDNHRVSRPAESAADDPWSDEELRATVEAYLRMLRAERLGESYVKAEENRRLREGPLSGRNKASVEFRMQNVSAVLNQQGLPWIDGYKPHGHVGAGVGSRIAAILEDLGVPGSIEYLPTDDEEELDRRTAKLRKRGIGESPPGKKKPNLKQGSSVVYERDPAVKAWVLECAKGICERCSEPAPFINESGEPFLELHHVLPLGDGGSDTVQNAAAVCPNCHRRCHHSQDKLEATRTLYDLVDRLREEYPP